MRVITIQQCIEAASGKTFNEDDIFVTNEELIGHAGVMYCQLCGKPVDRVVVAEDDSSGDDIYICADCVREMKLLLLELPK